MRNAPLMAVKRCIVFALGLTTGILPLRSATLQRLSLDEMITKSTAIVRAKVVDSYSAFSGPIVYTHYQLQVSERFKGPHTATVEVLVPGGVAGNTRQTFTGTPAFQPGDEFVFFLWTSPAGLTHVIGLTQGLFSIPRGAGADPVVTRAASHEVMLDGKTGRQVRDQALAMRLSELRSRIAGTLAGAAQ